MDIEWIRRYCLSLPHATESLQWDDNLVFKLAGKMFAIAALNPTKVWLMFKCSPEDFAEFTERASIIPAPYLARHHWIALETEDALSMSETRRLVHASYDLVLAKLPRKARAALA